MKYVYSAFIFFTLIMIAVFSLSARQEERPSFTVKLPVYPDGYDIRKDMKQSQWDQEVFYKVNVDFPASNVISFYENEFRKNGFLPYAEDGYGTRAWENFEPGTGKWERTSKVPARYIATWVDKDKTIRIVLFIRYKYESTSKVWAKLLLVNCSVGKFFKHDEGQPLK